jgi:exopolyphosphatase/guanosine-5'-triphosphate,3'-diphosphate pyrophosphatase
MAARLELRPVKAFFRGVNGMQAIGTSGTILSVERVAQELGLAEIGITLDTIEALIERVLCFENTAEISLKGLSDRRAQVWPGGLSILAELFSTLRIDEMRISDGAVREGLLYDLLGRLQHEDARERTVRAMVARYQVDEDQAQRVATTAAAIFGLDIAHDGYQRHGAYIAENADMPGFPRAEQRLLAALIGGQRHAINESRLDTLPRSWRTIALRLLIILRLAVLLNRSRNAAAPADIVFKVTDGSLVISFDASWLADNPLTIADMEREQEFLEKVGYRLSVE